MAPLISTECECDTEERASPETNRSAICGVCIYVRKPYIPYSNGHFSEGIHPSALKYTLLVTSCEHCLTIYFVIFFLPIGKGTSSDTMDNNSAIVVPINPGLCINKQEGPPKQWLGSNDVIIPLLYITIFIKMHIL